jgi:hypothetical protein
VRAGWRKASCTLGWTGEESSCTVKAGLEKGQLYTEGWTGEEASCTVRAGLEKRPAVQ